MEKESSAPPKVENRRIDDIRKSLMDPMAENLAGESLHLHAEDSKGCFEQMP